MPESVKATSDPLSIGFAQCRPKKQVSAESMLLWEFVLVSLSVESPVRKPWLSYLAIPQSANYVAPLNSGGIQSPYPSRSHHHPSHRTDRLIQEER